MSPTAAIPSNAKKNAAIDAPNAGIPANTAAPTPPVAAVTAPKTPPTPTSAPRVLIDLSLRESIANPKLLTSVAIDEPSAPNAATPASPTANAPMNATIDAAKAPAPKTNLAFILSVVTAPNAPPATNRPPSVATDLVSSDPTAAENPVINFCTLLKSALAPSAKAPAPTTSVAAKPAINATIPALIANRPLANDFAFSGEYPTIAPPVIRAPSAATAGRVNAPIAEEKPVSIVFTLLKSKLAPRALAPANRRSPANRPAKKPLMPRPMNASPLAADLPPPNADANVAPPKSVPNTTSPFVSRPSKIVPTPVTALPMAPKSNDPPNAVTPANIRSPANRPPRKALIAKPIVPNPIAPLVPPTAPIAVIAPNATNALGSIT